MNTRMQRALSALMASPTIAEAAKAAGVSERTMQRYVKDPEFARAYAEATKQLTDEAAARLLHAIGPAVSTLESVCQDGNSPPYARVQAASAILSHGLKAIERGVVEVKYTEVPTFVYCPGERRREPPIPPEVYEEVERALLGDDEEGREQ